MLALHSCMQIYEAGHKARRPNAAWRTCVFICVPAGVCIHVRLHVLRSDAQTYTQVEQAAHNQARCQPSQQISIPAVRTCMQIYPATHEAGRRGAAWRICVFGWACAGTRRSHILLQAVLTHTHTSATDSTQLRQMQAASPNQHYRIAHLRSNLPGRT